MANTRSYDPCELSADLDLRIQGRLCEVIAESDSAVLAGREWNRAHPNDQTDYAPFRERAAMAKKLLLRFWDGERVFDSELARVVFAE